MKKYKVKLDEQQLGRLIGMCSDLGQWTEHHLHYRQILKCLLKAKEIKK